MNRKKLFAALAICLAAALLVLAGCASKETPATQEPWQNATGAQASAGPIKNSEEASEQMVEVSNTMAVLIAELEGIDSEM